MDDLTCVDIMDDGEPCGAPATHELTLPNEKKGLTHSVCGDCAAHHEEHTHGATAQERTAAAVEPSVPDAPSESAAQVTPDEHSDVVGGSTAARRIGCPRSYALEQLVPKDGGSIYAREGTALHEMIAIVLDQDVEPDTLLPFTFTHEAKDEDDPEGTWSHTVTEDLWYEVGQPALDAFDAFIADMERDQGAPFEYEVEKRCAMPAIAGAFGTSDVIWSCGKVSGVWDWKFGRKRVTAARNSQASFYGRAAMSTAPHLFGGAKGEDTPFSKLDPSREVVLSIMQPRCGDDPDNYSTTVGELEEYRIELVAAVKEAETLGLDARIEKGDWCDFARCKAVCPLHAGRSAEFGHKMSKLAELADRQGTKDIAKITATDSETGEESFVLDAMLPELLDLAEVAAAWAKTLFGIAHRNAEQGKPVEGWKLKAKRSSGREWAVDDAAVRKFMKNRRYTLDAFAPRKTATMPQCETMLKKDGRTIPEDMVRHKVSTGTTLVRADHPAPAAKLTADKAQDLGDRLAALTSK